MLRPLTETSGVTLNILGRAVMVQQGSRESVRDGVVGETHTYVKREECMDDVVDDQMEDGMNQTARTKRQDRGFWRSELDVMTRLGEEFLVRS